MYWSKWSWLALAGFLAVAFVAWVLFAPDIQAVHAPAQSQAAIR